MDKHQLMKDAIAATLDDPANPDSARNIHLAAARLEGQHGMSEQDWLDFYDGEYQRAPVAPASPEIVLATYTPHPSVFNFYDTAADADAARVERGLDHKVMSYSDFEAGRLAFYLAQPLRAETPETFDAAFGLFSPVAWEHADGVERFIVREAESGSIHRQYARRGERCVSRLVNILDPKTWITGADVDSVGFAAREEARRATGQAGGRS